MVDDHSIAAIPTVWRGVRFKSRLEARFAEWLADRLIDSPPTTQIYYEPHRIGRNQYLPDFLVSDATGGDDVYVEIKPIRFASEASIAIEAARETGIRLLLIDSLDRDTWGCFASVVCGRIDFFTSLEGHALQVGVSTRRWRPMWFPVTVSEDFG